MEKKENEAFWYPSDLWVLSLVFKGKFTENEVVEGVTEFLKFAAMVSVPRSPCDHVKSLFKTFTEWCLCPGQQLWRENKYTEEWDVIPLEGCLSLGQIFQNFSRPKNYLVNLWKCRFLALICRASDSIGLRWSPGGWTATRNSGDSGPCSKKQWSGGSSRCVQRIVVKWKFRAQWEQRGWGDDLELVKAREVCKRKCFWGVGRTATGGCSEVGAGRIREEAFQVEG